MLIQRDDRILGFHQRSHAVVMSDVNVMIGVADVFHFLDRGRCVPQCAGTICAGEGRSVQKCNMHTCTAPNHEFNVEDPQMSVDTHCRMEGRAKTYPPPGSHVDSQPAKKVVG